MHACLYTCMHARMHTCRHSYMQTCLHARLPSHTNIQKHRHRVRNDMHTCIPTYLPAYIRTCIHTHSFQKRGIQRYRQTQIHAWMIMDACKHGSIVACMHVYTVTHTQTYIYIHIACMSAWQSRAGVESRDA